MDTTSANATPTFTASTTARDSTTRTTPNSVADTAMDTRAYLLALSQLPGSHPAPGDFGAVPL